MRIAVGLACGLGNSIFMLPTIKALAELGHELDAFVQTDFDTRPLWRRCRYFRNVYDAATQPPEDRRVVMGQWSPPAWRRRPDLRAAIRFQIGYPYTMSETDSNMRIARSMGWTGPRPDVSAWCKSLNRTKKYDFGFIPGTKGGEWIRKRYPQMKKVAKILKDEGARTAVIGIEQDGIREIQSDVILASDNISLLPEALVSCRVIIANDGGLAHVASSLGIPTLMIFTSTSPLKGEPIGPHRIVRREMSCSPCVSTPQWHHCRDWKCQGIEPETIVAIARKMRKEQGQ
jgi:hypothetical protein